MGGASSVNNQIKPQLPNIEVNEPKRGVPILTAQILDRAELSESQRISQTINNNLNRALDGLNNLPIFGDNYDGQYIDRSYELFDTQAVKDQPKKGPQTRSKLSQPKFQVKEYEFSSATQGNKSHQLDWNVTDPTPTAKIIDIKAKIPSRQPSPRNIQAPIIAPTHDTSRMSKTKPFRPEGYRENNINTKSTPLNSIVIAPTSLPLPEPAIETAPDLIDDLLSAEELTTLYRSISNKEVKKPLVSQPKTSTTYSTNVNSPGLDGKLKPNILPTETSKADDKSRGSISAARHEHTIVFPSVVQPLSKTLTKAEISKSNIPEAKLKSAYIDARSSNGDNMSDDDGSGGEDKDTIGDTSVYDWIQNTSKSDASQQSTRYSESVKSSPRTPKSRSFLALLENSNNSLVNGNDLSQKPFDSISITPDKTKRVKRASTDSIDDTHDNRPRALSNHKSNSLEYLSTQNQITTSNASTLNDITHYKHSINHEQEFERTVQSNASAILESFSPSKILSVGPQALSATGTSTRYHMSLSNAPAQVPIHANIQNFTVKETTDVKRNLAQLPRNLPHPKPVSGDWANKRYFVNNYILLDSIGKGAYGEVRLCRDRRHDQLLAMKIISKDMMKKKKSGNTSETYFEDIKREIAIMKKLLHPNILRLYEVLDDPKVNKLYLVLEYMKKGDLISYLKGKDEAANDNQPTGSKAGNGTSTGDGNVATGKKPKSKVLLSDVELWNIFRQVSSGIKYLHYQNVIHGDIKPQNLLVSDDGIVKIADFGISKMLHVSSQKLADAAGTPAFMSPELCSGESFSGQLADVWALGATMFMLRFGHPPFVAKTILNLYHKIQNDPLVFPFAIDSQLQHLLSGMLEKDPDKRFTLNDVTSHSWLQTPPAPNCSRGVSARGNRNNGAKDNIIESPSKTTYVNLVEATSPSYILEEEQAMQRPVTALDDQDILKSIGVGQIQQSDTGLTENSKSTGKSNLEENNDSFIETEENIMHTNWGDDVFQIVGENDEDGINSDDNSDEDTVDSDDLESPRQPLPSLKTQNKQNEHNTSAKSGKADSSFDIQDSKSDSVLSPRVISPPSNNKATILKTGPINTNSSLPAISSSIDKMITEEEELKMQRFQNLFTKKISSFSMSSNTLSYTHSINKSKDFKSSKDFSFAAPRKDSAESQASILNIPSLGVTSYISDLKEKRNSLSNISAKDSSRKSSTLDNFQMSRSSSSSKSILGADDNLNELSMEAFGTLMDTLAVRLDTEQSIPVDYNIDLTSKSFFEANINQVYPLLYRNEYNRVASAFHSEQGNRESQEDRCVLALNLSTFMQCDAGSRDIANQITIGCIFDGHSGHTCSEYLRDHFIGLIASDRRLLMEKNSIVDAIAESCRIADQQVLEYLRHLRDDSGSTGVVAVYNGVTNSLTVGNVGDSICVVSQRGKAVKLSKMHRVDNRDEKERVLRSGGTILNNRVSGVLAITRAFGDCAFKEGDGQTGPIISVPEIWTESISATTEFAIIATDGLWDVMKPQAAVNFVRQQLHSKVSIQEAAKALVVEAIAEGSIDNVTALVMAFNVTL